jgi:hypothetical protein
MEFTSKHCNYASQVYLDKISEAIRDLNSITDTLPFVHKMVSLSALLSSFDQQLNNSFPVIDDKADDPTYFIAAYFDIKNVAEALWIYKIVRSLTRYILLSDRFYETGIDRYALLAKQVHESVIKSLQSEYDAQHLIYSIDYLLDQFSAFWKFEQMKCRILKNHTFS